MLKFRKKPALPAFRVLDTPIPMWICPTSIITAMPGGKVLRIDGNFENISDADACFTVEKTLAKIAS